MLFLVITVVSLAYGEPLLANHWRVTPEAARSGIFTAVSLMARAFGEAFGYSDGGRNQPPNFIDNTCCDLDLRLYGIGNTVMGTADNNVLWSLALVLLLMSLAFNNSVIKFDYERKRKENYAR